MVSQKQIKIIKRDDRYGGNNIGGDNAKATRSAEFRSDSEQSNIVAGKKNAATIVNGWVSELRRRKIKDARQEFESLFSNAA